VTRGGEKRPDADQLASELARRWRPSLVNQNWAGRVDLIRQMHEQLQDDLEDLQLYAEVSPLLIKKIIDALGAGPIESVEQAHVYANSADKKHRDAAGAWLGRQQKSGRNSPKS